MNSVRCVSLVGSPNWFESSVADFISEDLIAYGAKQFVYYLKVRPSVSPDDNELMYNGSQFTHHDKVIGVAAAHFVKDKVAFATVGLDSYVRLWDYERGACDAELNLAPLGIDARPTCVACAPEEPRVLLGFENGALICWEPFTGGAPPLVRQIEREAVLCLSFAPAQYNSSEVGVIGSLAAVGYRKGTLAVYRFAGHQEMWQQQRLRGHDDEVQSLAWNPSPQSQEDPHNIQLASSSRDRSLKLWNLEHCRLVANLRLPNQVGHKRFRADPDDQQRRLWISLCWPQFDVLICSTSFGELLQWNPLDEDNKGRQQRWSSLNASRGHNRLIFSLPCSPSGQRMLAVGQDRLLTVWKMPEPAITSCLTTEGKFQEDSATTASRPERLAKQTGYYMSIGGFVLAAAASPLTPSLLALGCGDNLIRLWRQSARCTDTRSYDISTLWQGVSGRVTALSWHPYKESCLAFATEDGRVGLFDALAGKNAQARLSSTNHKSTVYSICWAPLDAVGVADLASANFVLYSVGSWQIMRHNSNNLAAPAFDFGRWLVTHTTTSVAMSSDGGRRGSGFMERTDLAWRHDYQLFAVGNRNGLVEIHCLRASSGGLHNHSHLQQTPIHLATITVHHKSVNTLKWHPGYQEECRNWLAIGTNERALSVVDLSNVAALAVTVAAFGKDHTPLQIAETMSTLRMHGNRVTSLTWSPHDANQLLSCSYDGTAQVWDVRNACGLSNFRGHNGRLYCVHWSPLEPDLCFSGGEDCCLLAWRPSEQDPTSSAEPPKGKRWRQPLPPGMVTQPPTQDDDEDADVDTLEAAPEQLMSTASERQQHQQQSRIRQPSKRISLAAQQIVTELDLQELMELIEIRKAQLYSSTTVAVDNKHADDDDVVGVAPSSIKKTANISAPVAKNKDLLKPTTTTSLKDAIKMGIDKRKRPSIFATSTATSNSRECAIEDAILLVRVVTALEKLDLPSHLGLLFDRKSLHRQLELELAGQLTAAHPDNYLVLLMWAGRFEAAVKEAVDCGYLPDWLMAIDALCRTPHSDIQLVQSKARQLAQAGDPVLGATYLLAAGRPQAAVQLLRDRRLLREALLLAKLRLLPEDELLTTLMEELAEREHGTGAYESEARVFAALNRPEAAAAALLRRPDSELHAARLLAAAGSSHWALAARRTLEWLSVSLLNPELSTAYHKDSLRKALPIGLACCLVFEVEMFERLAKLGQGERLEQLRAGIYPDKPFYNFTLILEKTLGASTATDCKAEIRVGAEMVLNALISLRDVRQCTFGTAQAIVHLVQDVTSNMLAAWLRNEDTRACWWPLTLQDGPLRRLIDLHDDIDDKEPAEDGKENLAPLMSEGKSNLITSGVAVSCAVSTTAAVTLGDSNCNDVTL